MISIYGGDPDCDRDIINGPTESVTMFALYLSGMSVSGSADSAAEGRLLATGAASHQPREPKVFMTTKTTTYHTLGFQIVTAGDV